MAMDKSWIEKPRKSLEYAQGVQAFINFAFEHRSVNDRIVCICSRCGFKKWQPRDVVYEHLTTRQFPKGYTFWFYHGETREAPSNASSTNALNVARDNRVDKNPTKKMINDAVGVDKTRADAVPITSSKEMGDDKGAAPNVTLKSNKTKEICESERDGEQPLYEGCTKYSKLSFLLKLYRIKCLCGMSNDAMTMLLELLQDAFQQARIPGSFYEAKKTVGRLGLNHDNINVSSKNCVLYQDNKDDKEKQICTVCDQVGWKLKAKGDETKASGDDNGNKIDLARVRYFLRNKEVPRDGLHTASACAREGQPNSPCFQSSGEPQLPPEVPRSGVDVGESFEVLAPASKRVREAVPLFYENSKGIKSYWDTCDTSYAWSQTKGIINEEDQYRLESYSLKQLLEFAAGDFARGFNLIAQFSRRADRYQRVMLQAESAEKKSNEENSKLTDEIAQLTKERDHWKEKHTREESAKLREEIAQLTKDRDHWKEMYGQEVTTRKKFLKSSSGRTSIASMKEEGVEEFKESDSYDAIVLKKASVIYEQTIRDCRRVLRETGRYPPEDLLLLDPTIPDVTDDTNVMQAPGVAPDAMVVDPGI